MLRTRILSLLPAALASVLFTLGCLGTLHSNGDAERIAGAAEGAIPLPLRETRPHWFLRQETGWVGAHRMRFGGEGDDEGFAFVRVALFTDPASATSALARITPEYMRSLWEDRVGALPRLVAFPVTIPGDEVMIAEYPLRASPVGDDPDMELIVQVIALRVGRVIVVIESIGTPRESLAPVAASLVAAARAFGAAAP